MIDRKELKKIMTKLAKGELSQKEVDSIVKPKKTPQKGLKQEIKGNTRKRQIKLREVKKQ